jgi:chemotaxis family two-component system response regulator Rcp1
MLPDPSPFNLLIIEDNPAEVRLMLEAARRAEMADNTHIAYTYAGPEGLDMLHQAQENENGYHVVLLDLNMPKVTGRDILQMIKADRSLDKLSVFVMTNSDYKLDIEECRKLGADAFFQKPPDFKRLVDFFTSLNDSRHQGHCISVSHINKRYEELDTAA